jgi:TRAP-type C4-dicarboxylate transport system substrate-binding protein
VHAGKRVVSLIRPMRETLLGSRTASYGWQSLANIVHEISHVICAVPFLGTNGIDATPERFVQDAFDRAILQSFSDLGQKRLDSRAQGSGDLAAEKRCVRVGLLRRTQDGRLLPTYKWPDWTKLPRHDQAVLRAAQRQYAAYNATSKTEMPEVRRARRRRAASAFNTAIRKSNQAWARVAA